MEPYSKEKLLKLYKKKQYSGKCTEVAFLLGGIGTGNISVGARGELRDWEIYNAPGKGNTSDYSFFAMRIKEEGEEPKAKVLESRMQPPFSRSSVGYSAEKFAGLPRFENSSLSSEYPFVNVELKDKSMPVAVEMEAFTPFIPLNPDDSGIPGAIIRYKVKNKSEKAMEVSVAGSLTNSIGYVANSDWGFTEKLGIGHNEKREDDICKGVYMTTTNIPEKNMKYGNMALMTKEQNTTIKANWYEGAWWDGIHDYWDDFMEDGQLDEVSPKIGVDSQLVHHKTNKVGAVCVKKQLQPEEEATFEFAITWYMPNRPNEWPEKPYEYGIDNEDTIPNHYASLYADAWNVGTYLYTNLPSLEDTSRAFTKALYESTIPQEAMEAVANTITVLRSPTCFRIEGGHFLAWEGSHNRFGSCAGTCTHVWNYAQTMAFLFPSLERSARTTEFNFETDVDGNMHFRTDKRFGNKNGYTDTNFAAADGQLGVVIRLYREWKLSGDDEFLKSVWENAKKVVDYAFQEWDSDGDFVLDDKQHNTYDIEFYGPNAMVNSMFFGALKAVGEMAEYLGEEETSKKYKEAFEKGSKRMDALLWEDDYYIQRIEDVNAYKYQYGMGCLSDQLIGQTLAHVAGLGYVLPEEHVKKAVKSIFDYNFRDTLEEHYNVQRTYALNDEAGLLLCSWPKGGRPRIPFVYSDEVWTGIEYQVATHLIYEGFIEEGLTIVKACRDRYDGIKRNPWSDIECGHHYARSLASWGILTGLSGFTYDMTKDHMEFAPKINQDNFKCFWSTGKEWGTYSQVRKADGTMERKIERM